MIKIFNRLCFHLKNIILPMTLAATIYIVMFMFKRIDKEMLDANLVEFITIILPYVLLMLLSIINLFFNQKSVKDNTLYNVTSLIVVITISVFCYRAMMDENMLFWHKYGYKINFNYFSDQMAAIKVMLYGLSIANIILMISGAIKEEPQTETVNDKKVNKNKEKKS